MPDPQLTAAVEAKIDQGDVLLNNDDFSGAADLYRQAEKILQQQGVYVPLYYGYAYALFKPRIGGIPMTSAGVPQPDWNIFVDMQRSLYIKKS